MAYTSDIYNSQSNTPHNVTLLAKGLESTQTLPDLPKGNFEQALADQWKLDIKDFFGFDSCITLDDIQGISIIANSNDAWNIGSIVTFAVNDNDCREQISADYSIDQWIDGNGAAENVEYQLSLTTTTGSCINYLHVVAYTSNVGNSATTGNHTVELKADGLVKTAAISNIPNELRGKLWSLSLAGDFGFNGCIRKKDVQGIAILAYSNDGWNIESILTYVSGNYYDSELSSADWDVNRWVDNNSSGSSKRFDLNLVI